MKDSTLKSCLFLFPLLLFCGHVVAAEPDSKSQNWPGFRGPAGTGHSSSNGVAPRWNSDDIAWQVDLPVQGHSSPVVWEDRIFLTGWTQANGQVHRHVICLSRQTGELMWNRDIATGSGEELHKMNSWATPSCATDGTCVVAFFGAGGLHCLSMDGDPRWSRDLGQFPGAWGVGASPIIVDEMVIQNADAEGESFLLAVDKSTGKDVWKTPRREKPKGGWSTPLPIVVNGQRQLALNGEFGVEAYNPDNGEPLWFCKSFNGRGTPVPAWDGKTLFVVNGKAGDVYAIDPSGRGDVTETHMRWHTPRKGGRDLPSPIVSNDVMLVIGMAGIATGYDCQDGRELWKERLAGNFSGSPVSAGGLVYIAAENGEVIVLRLGEQLEVVSKNPSPLTKDEIVRSSLAISGGQFLLRSDKRLYCIGAN
ncbi:outer membrane protein assembly factor BamB family protein [Stieleria varia]|uniref:Outer membrane biogenesis protein BamB n=1 Tax=Stieleria varia TaxID=2528005 RepID=A0A5C5ZLP9_9BACT|nr:PQQ-binding-like beta-propeller repeat protein [Stieleria varia]TWT88070.1 outer membrane biogenesis protein BamB [Stieleria varia]